MEFLISASFLACVMILFFSIYGFVVSRDVFIPSTWHEFARRYRLHYEYQQGITHAPQTDDYGEPIVPANPESTLHYLSGTYRHIPIELYYHRDPLDKTHLHDFALHIVCTLPTPAPQPIHLNPRTEWAELAPYQTENAEAWATFQKIIQALPADQLTLTIDGTRLHLTASHTPKGKTLTHPRRVVPLLNALCFALQRP